MRAENISPGTEPITLAESKRLIELEKIIEAGRQTFVEVGTALAEIRDSRLYKADFSTFEDYCIHKWGFKRAHAHRLIEAAGIATELSPVGDIPSERVARELVKVPKEKRKTVIKAAITTAKSTGRKLTAKTISEAAQLPSITAVETPKDVQARCPRAQTKRRLVNWYFNTTKQKRGEFLNFIFTNCEVVVDNKAKFKQRVDGWFERLVSETRTPA